MENPSLKSFFSAFQWPVANFLLGKAGLKKHLISIVTPPKGPFGYYEFSLIHDFQAYKFIQRPLDLSLIGLICHSNTEPSIRELFIRAKISSENPISISPNSTSEVGFDEKEKFEGGKIYNERIDYTKILDRSTERSELLKLESSIIHYPFRNSGTNLLLTDIYEKYREEIDADNQFGLQIFSSDERDYIELSYKDLFDTIEIHIGIVLDNEDVLLYRWDPHNQYFFEDFYNAGITNA